MKINKSTSPQFPLSINITVENKDELLALIARFNCSTSTLEKNLPRGESYPTALDNVDPNGECFRYMYSLGYEYGVLP